MPLTLKNTPTYYEIGDLFSNGVAATSFMQNVGGIIKIEPLARSVMDITRTVPMSDSLLYITGTIIQAKTRLTGMLAFQTVQGNYTGDNYNGMALFKWNGTAIILVASTTNDADIWKAASNTWVQKAFTTPYNADQGIYYMTAVYNNSAQTTAPSLGGMPLMQNAGSWDTIIPAGTAPYMSESGTTALVSPIPTPGTVNNGMYFALY